LFWFMLIALVVVVAAVAMAVLGDSSALKDPDPDRIDDRLPPDRPLVRADIDEVRLPVAVRGYRMLDVDEVLDRLGAELSERDARIAELESTLAGVQAGAQQTGTQQGPQNGVPGGEWQHGPQPHGATLLKGGVLPPAPDQGQGRGQGQGYEPGDDGE
jgi:DivIVA domain-containing protein